MTPLTRSLLYWAYDIQLNYSNKEANIRFVARVTDYTSSRGSIWFQTNVSTANLILNSDFKTYSNATSLTKLRTLQYSIPEVVAPL